MMEMCKEKVTQNKTKLNIVKGLLYQQLTDISINFHFITKQDKSRSFPDEQHRIYAFSFVRKSAFQVHQRACAHATSVALAYVKRVFCTKL